MLHGIHIYDIAVPHTLGKLVTDADNFNATFRRRLSDKAGNLGRTYIDRRYQTAAGTISNFSSLPMILLSIPLDTGSTELRAGLHAGDRDFCTASIATGLTTWCLPNNDTVGQTQIDYGDFRIEQLVSILHFR